MLLNKIKSWEPKYVDRPLSADQTSNWEWIAPYNGTLYLVFITYERSYATVHYNDSAIIATVAVPGASSPTVVTVPITVKKGDKINVNNLGTECFLSNVETSFIRGGV